MSTQKPTLTDFLLARIAEDEDAGRKAGSTTDAEPSILWPNHHDYWGTPTEGLTISAARVLAECAARRRIVERCAAIHALPWWEYEDAPDLADDVLAALALPYAGHRDYRPEWRP